MAFLVIFVWVLVILLMERTTASAEQKTISADVKQCEGCIGTKLSNGFHTKMLRKTEKNKQELILRTKGTNGMYSTITVSLWK